jgi:hypothetical protein
LGQTSEGRGPRPDNVTNTGFDYNIIIPLVSGEWFGVGVWKAATNSRLGSPRAFPSCYIYLVEYVVKPLMNAESHEAVIDKEAPNWHRLAGILDARLAKSKWLVGGNVTIADIAVAAPMHVHKWPVPVAGAVEIVTD